LQGLLEYLALSISKLINLNPEGSKTESLPFITLLFSYLLPDKACSLALLLVVVIFSPGVQEAKNKTVKNKKFVFIVFFIKNPEKPGFLFRLLNNRLFVKEKLFT
jgi:hypothetical protein